jgi:alpha-tubulin suppressor-like RCC1 family protein
VRVGRLLVVALLTAVLLDAPAASQPLPERSGSSDWRSVTTGNGFSCGIRTTGRLFCWGWNHVGEAGSDPDTDPPTPTQVTGGGADWTTVAAGGSHACGLRRPGRLFCWGWDLYGQIGDGAADAGADQPAPIRVGTASDWTAVTAGNGHTCGRRANGRLYCWGADGAGQLGNGGLSADRPTPALVAGGTADWTAVSAGGNHPCGRRANGRLYCWGSDDDGQLGDGNPAADRATPTLVAGGATTWVQVSAGAAHTCGRQRSGQLLCWGEGTLGALGQGTSLPDQLAPVPVVGGPVWTTVDAGGDNTCARRRTGRLFCWGPGFSGQIGNGGSGAESQVNAPAEVMGGATDWTAVSVGSGHSCARITTGRLFCWGANVHGGIGDGTSGNIRTTPTDVAA